MFVGKARNLPLGNLKGGLLWQAANIRLDYKGMLETKTLAYYEEFVNYDCKKFYNNRP
jgi:hypothetical protein